MQKKYEICFNKLLSEQLECDYHITSCNTW